MEQVKMDQKGRIQIPKKFRKRLKLRPRQKLTIGISVNGLVLNKSEQISEESDEVLNDMINRPLRLKGIKLTKRLLDKLEEEAWST